MYGFIFFKRHFTQCLQVTRFNSLEHNFFVSFFSSLHNKGVYVKMGIRKMMGRKMCKDMHKEIRLEVDGKLVDLPPVEGIIILNILR